MLDASTYTSRVNKSARMLIRRVMRILTACGMSIPELQEIFLQESETAEASAHPKMNRATAPQIIVCSDVVLKWRRDSRFLTSEGLPSHLRLQGTTPNFGDLVKAVSPSDDPNQLLEMLKDLGVVRFTKLDEIELVSESVVACSGRDGLVIASEPVLEHICGFLGSVEYNLFDKPSRARGRFERACYASVPGNLVPVLENLVSSRGQDFVDVIDEWLARRAIRPSNGAGTVLVGAGAYVFVRENVT